MNLPTIPARYRRDSLRGSWPWPEDQRWQKRVRRLARRLIKERDFSIKRPLDARSWLAKREVADISDGICAYIVGGLGNQLFVLAAAWEQAERLGCPLYVDSSWYHHRYDDRTSEISAIDHPGIDVTDRSPWEGRNLLSGPAGLVPVTSGRRQLQVFTEQGFAYDPLIDTCEPGTTISGFCQSPMYFQSIADTLADRLLSAELQPSELQYVDAVAHDLRTTLHIRRGDYMYSHTQDFLGIAQIGYFRRAAELYERLNGETNYRAYSDSAETLDEMLSDFPTVEISRPTSSMSALAVMRAMATAKGFVMSNSTFSWWAAWLLPRRQPQATVIAPRPWFTDGESACDLLLPHWITLDRRD